MSPRRRNVLDTFVSRADRLLRDFDLLEEQLAASSKSARAHSLKSAFSSNFDEYEIAIEAVRTESLRAESKVAGATFSSFSGERDVEAIGSSTGLGLIHSGYNDIGYDDLLDAPTTITTTTFASSVIATGREYLDFERTVPAFSSKKSSERVAEISRGIETDADGFKKPLPPKRIHRNAEDFLSFLDSPPPPGDDFLSETEKSSDSLSHYSTIPSEQCSRLGDGREGEEEIEAEEEEEGVGAQGRDGRPLEEDFYEVLDLSLPKRR